MAGKRIKRHTRIYRTDRNYRLSPFRVSISVLAFLVLFCIGWGLYTPVYNFVMRLGEPSSTQSDPSQPSDSQSASGGQSSQSAGSVSPASLAEIKAVYMPPSMINNISSLDSFLTGLKGTGINAVMVDLKDASGNLLYRSQLPAATEVRAVSASAFDAAALSLRISNAGFMPIARIHVFKDQVMPRSKRETAVMYMNSEWTWLDNSSEKGGKPWLNPYSSKAQEYIRGIALEVTGLGFKAVVADSVQFPSGVGLEKAAFGSESSGISHQKVLSDFLAKLGTDIKAAGGRLLVFLPGEITEANEQSFYGGNRFGIVPESAVVGLPAEGSVTEIVKAASQKLSGKGVIYLFEAYVSGGANLTASQTAERVSWISSIANNGYILYNPGGRYGLYQSVGK